MRKCVICQKEYRESTEEQKYCDYVCRRAARLKLTRAEYEQRRQERERRFAEEVRRAGEAGYDNCVIFRDDGGRNRQYLAGDGTWTVTRAEAARCLSSTEAVALARKHGVTFFGGPTGRHPTCDLLCFRRPGDYDRWLAEADGETDARNPDPTERYVRASLESVVPELKARDLLRRASKDGPEEGPQPGR